MFSSFSMPRPSLPGGGVMLTPYKDPRYGYVGDAPTTGNYNFQMPDGSIQQAPYHAPSGFDQLIKGLAIAGVGAGFGAGALSAFAPETAASLGLGSSAAADIPASVPITASPAGFSSAGSFAGLGSSAPVTSAALPEIGASGGLGSALGNLGLGDIIRLGGLGMTGAQMLGLGQPGAGSSGASPSMPMGPPGPQPQYANTPFQLPQLMNFDRPGQGNMYGNANSMGGLGASPFGLPRMMGF